MMEVEKRKQTQIHAMLTHTHWQTSSIETRHIRMELGENDGCGNTRMSGDEWWEVEEEEEYCRVWAAGRRLQAKFTTRLAPPTCLL